MLRGFSTGSYLFVNVSWVHSSGCICVSQCNDMFMLYCVVLYCSGKLIYCPPRHCTPPVSIGARPNVNEQNVDGWQCVMHRGMVCPSSVLSWSLLRTTADFSLWTVDACIPGNITQYHPLRWTLGTPCANQVHNEAIPLLSATGFVVVTMVERRQVIGGSWAL